MGREHEGLSVGPDRRCRGRVERLAGAAVRGRGAQGRAGRAQCRTSCASWRLRSVPRPPPATPASPPRWRRCSRPWTRRSAGRRTSSSTMPARAARGPLVELDPAAVANALRVSAFGGFLVAQQAARRMLPRGEGAILFTGASASVKGYKLSAPFAMGKFALRGLAQSIARELAPQGIHVAHFVIDGAIRNPGRAEAAARIRCWIRTPSPAPTSTSCGRTAAPGPGRSSCALGSRISSGAGPAGRQPPRRRRRSERLAAAWRRSAGRPPASGARSPFPRVARRLGATRLGGAVQHDDHGRLQPGQKQPGPAPRSRRPPVGDNAAASAM